jgi:hypothetical protein
VLARSCAAAPSYGALSESAFQILRGKLSSGVGEAKPTQGDSPESPEAGHRRTRRRRGGRGGVAATPVMEDSPSFSPHLEGVSNDASLTEQLQELFEHLVHEVITHILAGLRGGPAEQTQWLADEQERVHVALSLRSGRLGGVPLGHKPHDLAPVPVQCVPYQVGPRSFQPLPVCHADKLRATSRETKKWRAPTVRRQIFGMNKELAPLLRGMVDRTECPPDGDEIRAVMRRYPEAHFMLKVLATTGSERRHAGREIKAKTAPEQKVVNALVGWQQMAAIARPNLKHEDLPLLLLLHDLSRARGASTSLLRQNASLGLHGMPDRIDRSHTHVCNQAEREALASCLTPGGLVSQQMCHGSRLSLIKQNQSERRSSVSVSSKGSSKDDLAREKAVQKEPKEPKRRGSSRSASLGGSTEDIGAKRLFVDDDEEAAPAAAVDRATSKAAAHRGINDGPTTARSASAAPPVPAGPTTTFHTLEVDTKVVLETCLRYYDNCNVNAASREVGRVHDATAQADITVGGAILPHAPVPQGLSHKCPDYVHVAERAALSKAALVARYTPQVRDALDSDDLTEERLEKRALSIAEAEGWSAYAALSEVPAECWLQREGTSAWHEGALPDDASAAAKRHVCVFGEKMARQLRTYQQRINWAQGVPMLRNLGALGSLRGALAISTVLSAAAVQKAELVSLHAVPASALARMKLPEGGTIEWDAERWKACARAMGDDLLAGLDGVDEVVLPEADTMLLLAVTSERRQRTSVLFGGVAADTEAQKAARRTSTVEVAPFAVTHQWTMPLPQSSRLSAVVEDFPQVAERAIHVSVPPVFANSAYVRGFAEVLSADVELWDLPYALLFDIQRKGYDNGKQIFACDQLSLARIVSVRDGLAYAVSQLREQLDGMDETDALFLYTLETLHGAIEAYKKAHVYWCTQP